MARCLQPCGLLLALRHHRAPLQHMFHLHLESQPQLDHHHWRLSAHHWVPLYRPDLSRVSRLEQRLELHWDFLVRPLLEFRWGHLPLVVSLLDLELGSASHNRLRVWPLYLGARLALCHLQYLAHLHHQ